MLVVPASFWQRLEAEGARSAVEQVIQSISIYAQAAVKVGATSWHRMQTRIRASGSLQSDTDLDHPPGINAASGGSTDSTGGTDALGVAATNEGRHRLNVDSGAFVAVPEAGAPWLVDHGRLDPESG